MSQYNQDNEWRSNPNPRKGKGAFVPGRPKKKAYQHPIDESGPLIKIPKVADQLLLVIYKEIWKDTVFQKCSHGLVANITEYLTKNKLI